MQFNGQSGEQLNQVIITQSNQEDLLRVGEGELRIFWNQTGETILEVDGIPVEIEPNELIFLTEYHHLRILKMGEGGLFRFNNIFYCLDNHDGEVGCKGMLFYGAMHLASIRLVQEDEEIFPLLWRVFQAEMQSRDNLQLEMLRMLMKRWIILCTRVFKRQRNLLEVEDHKLQVVKEFNLLVEIHFRNLHHVKDYADLLSKSPKTLTHTFSKYHNKTPLQVIQERILLEARRLLTYSNKPIKEIAYAIGFGDIQSFSRFFAHKTGLSPTAFREEQTEKSNPLLS